MGFNLGKGFFSYVNIFGNHCPRHENQINILYQYQQISMWLNSAALEPFTPSCVICYLVLQKNPKKQKKNVQF